MLLDKNNFNVVIIDKDASFRNNLSKGLQKEGFSVYPISDISVAFKEFESKKLKPDIIFFETNERDLEGSEFIKKIKKINEEIELVAMTTNLSDKTSIDYIRYSNCDYLKREEFVNQEFVSAVCNRAVDKIAIRQQYTQLMNEMINQNQDIMKKAKSLETKTKELEKKTSELERKSSQLEKLNKVIMRSQLEAEQRLKLSNTLYSILDSDQVLKAACDLMNSFSEDYFYAFWIYDKKSMNLSLKADSFSGLNQSDKIDINMPNELDSKGLNDFFDNLSNYPDFKKFMDENFKDREFALRTLVSQEGFSLGVFLVVAERGKTISRLATVNEMVFQVVKAYESALLHKKINEMAIKDGLTNLYNHKFFMESLEKEISKAHRYKYPLTLLFFDIDDFKIFNDKNGHQIGDKVLVKLSKILKANTRELDFVSVRAKGKKSEKKIFNDKLDSETELDYIVSRYGGEEFAIILPYTDLNGAKIMAERVRSAIEKADFPCQEKQPLGTLTISMGIAGLNKKIDTAKLLILLSDAALYKAKGKGKNRVEVADKELQNTILKKGKLDL